MPTIDLNEELRDAVQELIDSKSTSATWNDVELTGIKSNEPAIFEMLPEGYLPGEVFTFTVMLSLFPDTEPALRDVIVIDEKNYQIRSIQKERDFIIFNLAKIK